MRTEKLKIRRLPTPRIIALTVLIQCGWGWDATTADPLNKIVDWMAGRLAALESVEQTATLSIQIAFGEREDHMEQERRLFYQRPDRFHIISDMHVVVADGTHLQVAFPELDYFIKLPLDTDLATVIETEAEMVNAMVLPDVAALWSADPAVALQALVTQMTAEGLTLTIKDTIVHQGRPARHVRITDESGQGMLTDGLDVWIDEETGLLSGVAADLDFSGLMDAPEQVTAGTPTRYRLTYETQFIAINEPLGTDRFELDTTGWTELASFDELADRMQAASELPPARDWAGIPAPDFELELLDGTVFRLADQRGRVVLIDFWATWCPPCVESLPHLQSLYADLSGDNVVFLGISLDRLPQQQRVEAMLQQFDIQYKVGINAVGDIAAAYQVFSIPTLLIVDAEGIIRHQKVGFSPEQMGAVQEVLSESMNAAIKTTENNE